MSELFLNNVREQYQQKRLHRFFPLEVLEKRIETCQECEDFREVNCGVCGCSSYRFKEILLHANPSCPRGKHDQVSHDRTDDQNG